MPLPSNTAGLLLLWLISMQLSVCNEASAAGQCNADVGQCQEYTAAEASTKQLPLVQGQGSSATAADEPCSTKIVSSRFPSNNTVRRMTGKQLQELLNSFSANGSSSNKSAVVLFYLDTCPHSNALKPVFECMPAFFPETVVFASVPYADMSLMQLMTHGLHALPVLQVNKQGRKYRYNGRHWLGPMVAFVAKALSQEPSASLEVAQLCMPGPQQQQQQHGVQHHSQLLLLEAAAGDGRGNATPAFGDGSSSSSSSSSIQADVQQQQQQSVPCGNWSCSRWDGEATVEELSEQQHATLFWISVAFLACRAVWWTWQQIKRRRQTRAAQTPAAPAVAVDAAETAAAAGSADALADVDGQQQQQQQRQLSQQSSSSRDGPGLAQNDDGHPTYTEGGED